MLAQSAMGGIVATLQSTPAGQVVSFAAEGVPAAIQTFSPEAVRALRFLIQWNDKWGYWYCEKSRIGSKSITPHGQHEDPADTTNDFSRYINKYCQYAQDVQHHLQVLRNIDPNLLEACLNQGMQMVLHNDYNPELYRLSSEVLLGVLENPALTAEQKIEQLAQAVYISAGGEKNVPEDFKQRQCRYWKEALRLPDEATDQTLLSKITELTKAFMKCISSPERIDKEGFLKLTLDHDLTNLRHHFLHEIPAWIMPEAQRNAFRGIQSKLRDNLIESEATQIEGTNLSVMDVYDLWSSSPLKTPDGYLSVINNFPSAMEMDPDDVPRATEALLREISLRDGQPDIFGGEFAQRAINKTLIKALKHYFPSYTPMGAKAGEKFRHPDAEVVDSTRDQSDGKPAENGKPAEKNTADNHAASEEKPHPYQGMDHRMRIVAEGTGEAFGRALS